ncbi:hypothetical protein HanXRQr2_Chr15g0722691 [Helianthus annuus]|uniref:Putative ribosomal protein-related protein n=1 Tax=Helianthus annuus TaxID=4232 RepID=A0A251V3N4_HELAN|nr:uncharacterized protein LOC110937985 [Helianthus annuus]KAF5767054.1 hypothetical protein HanXRQr2_Chr15g0722691 [Helianthus annuus]KAJ0453356.1 hypothetical protein HanHA300_Chr15g0589431 [Helianthus annuus]KAJ0475280.1 hypothetical protein HanHA89_Chr15g0639311 [Helianthus annuus]KAJ0650837.1 hypothetical protein HanLR1_Chr15g0600231 [Helianthus annuus]
MMQQGSGAPPPRPIGLGGARGEKGKKKLPSPKEMVAHYESKGMQPQEASLKVIDDLQNLLLRVVTTKKTNDINNHHLLRLESKLDSKPGYPQTLAIGVVSGAVVHALPHLASIWNYVRSSTSSSSSSG